MAKAGDADIRISDAERDEAISTLGVHMSTGRLQLDEYEERCSRAGAALEVVAGLSVLVGIPGAILLTVIGGYWWVFIPVVVVFIVAASASEATRKPKTD